jgi:hypothetical protein
MKKFILFVAFAAATFTSYSQALGYEDLAILFSRDDQNGSARFMAMGGAFGALGGDVTSLAINPAGVSIFNGSHVSAAFQSRTSEFLADYYGTSTRTEQEYLDLTSAGAVFTFVDSYSEDWSKFAIGVNYRVLTDFDNTFVAQGNSGTATFQDFPFDTNATPIVYGIGENQRFVNTYRGELSELNLTFGGTFQDKLHVGAGLNFYDLNFAQFATLLETNSDGNGNTLNADFFQDNFTTGAGFSLSAGFIYKANKSLRLGLSYQSPTWMTEIIEDTNITDNDGFLGETIITVSEDPQNGYQNFTGFSAPRQATNYDLRQPSKLTASAAIIFGKSGLISFDYITRNFQGLNLNSTFDDFSPENQFFDNNLRRTNSFNVGTEWRFSRLSLRGGYSYQESPDANALDSDNLERYSAGLGYNFGKVKFNIAYSTTTQTGLYNFYSQFPSVQAAGLNIDNTLVTVGISVSL